MDNGNKISMKKDIENDLSGYPNSKRHCGLKRNRMSHNMDERDEGALFSRKTRLSLPLVIAALLTIQKLPQSSLAFNIQDTGVLQQRIRTSVTARQRNSNRHFAQELPSKLLKTRLSMGFDIDENAADDNELNSIIEDRILFDDIDDDLDDVEFLKRQMSHLESMEKMLEDIDDYCSIEGMCDDEGNIKSTIDDEIKFLSNTEDLEDMESLFDFLEESGAMDIEEVEDEEFAPEEEILPKESQTVNAASTTTNNGDTINPTSNPFRPKSLEDALLQGVVPVDAGVGSNTLPGDFGFDPLGIAEKDYMQNFQYRVLDALPGGNPEQDPPPESRPSALVLRDYREAEIRHGRLAMLAVVIWPIQEKLDQLLLEPSQCGPLLYGPITLPYFPLFMTLMLMLLGYLDIYTKDIQEEEGVGDAFLPGDCFWDPLKILEGAPATMTRNMQERELFNGRMAMLAFAAFVFEEATSRQAIIDIPGNEFLFVPAYQIPAVQSWLDAQFYINPLSS